MSAEKWSGARVVELEGPRRVTPNEIAIVFAKFLKRPVRMEIVPRASWESLFRSQGMKNPIPRIQMLDGFNEGWIEFEGGEANVRKGSTRLEPCCKLWSIVPDRHIHGQDQASARRR